MRIVANCRWFSLPPRVTTVVHVCCTALLLQAPLLSPAHSATNEERCNRDIGKAVAKLQRAYLANVGYCIRFENYSDCPTDDDRWITRARNELTRKVSDSASACSAAVNTDGVPLSSLGPSSCPPAWSQCAGSINTLEELRSCLLCVHSGHDVKYRLDLDLPDAVPDDNNERKCIRAAHKMVAKAIRTGLKEVNKCANGGVQPFSCPVDDSELTKFGRALEKIDRKIAKCRDESGVVGAVSGGARTLCNRAIVSTDDLALCLGELSRCIACKTANTTYDQDQDCEAFSGLWNCDGVLSTPASFFVANEGDDTVTFYNADGTYKQGALADSTFAVGDAPAAVAVNQLTNSVYVANKNHGTVTYLDASTGEYINGTLFNSSFVVGSMPTALAVDRELGVVYVINEGDNSVTMVDAIDGSYVYGDQADSTFAVGVSPVAVAVNTTDGILYVANSGEDTLTYLDSITGDYVYGTLAASSFSTGAGPAGIAWADSQGRVLVTNSLDDTVSVLEAVGGVPVYGTLEASTFAVGDGPGPVTFFQGHFYIANENESTFVALGSKLLVSDTEPIVGRPSSVAASGVTGRLYLTARARDEVAICVTGDHLGNSTFAAGEDPSGVAFNPNANLIYVANSGDDTVTYLDATTGANINGTFANSTFVVGDDPQGAAVNPNANLIYVANLGDDTVTYLDATTGAYMNGTLANSSFAVGDRPRGVAVNPASNLIYVANSGDDTLTYLDATTGAYMNGTLANSSFGVGNGPWRVAVNPAANLIYVANAGDATATHLGATLTYLDATTGAYLNGTLANSTSALGYGPGNVAVNPAANLVYVTSSALPDGWPYYWGMVTYLDATTGAYMNGTLTNSSFRVRDRTAVAVDPAANLVYVADTLGNTITYLDATTGAYMNGTLANSSFRVGRQPYGVAVNPIANLIYVANFWDNTVTYLDATNGASAFPILGLSPLETSTVVVNSARGVAFNPNANLVYVANYWDDTVTYLDATTPAYMNGPSIFAVGVRPSGVAFNPNANLIYVANSGSDTVTYLDATTGAYMNGTLANSSFAVGYFPKHVAVNPNANLIYVANSGSDTVAYLDATTGVYMNGTLANSSFTVGDDPKDVAVNPAANLIYVAVSRSTVTYLDATTGAYMSSSAVGHDPRGVAVNPTANLVYVTGSVSQYDHRGWVTYLDATTGAYMNGTFGNSSFIVGKRAAVAVNPAANLIYVAHSDGGVAYLDATTGAYMNGTFRNSSFTVGDDSKDVAVNPAANLIYVAHSDGKVTYLDATTGAGAFRLVCPQFVDTGSSPSSVAIMGRRPRRYQRRSVPIFGRAEN